MLFLPYVNTDEKYLLRHYRREWPLLGCELPISVLLQIDMINVHCVFPLFCCLIPYAVMHWRTQRRLGVGRRIVVNCVFAQNIVQVLPLHSLKL